jgi:membrane protein
MTAAMLSWIARRKHALFVSSRTMPSPWGPVLRISRYPAALIRDWLDGEINVRAMSLAYTTLLSLVPLIAFSFAILKVLGTSVNLGVLVYEFFRPVGTAAARELTRDVMSFVKNMRSDVVGWIGFTLLLYTVFTTIQKIEAGFHFVWRVERPRTLLRRLVEYLLVMTAGPLLIAAALAVLASARDSPLVQWTEGFPQLAEGLRLLGRAVPYAAVTAAFAIMYLIIPNTRVKWRAALIGGLAAGATWGLVGKIFSSFLVYSSRLMVIYTGFAVLLTTLIWIYVSWLILLLGAQLSFYIQYPQYLRYGLGELELSGEERERAGLTVMVLIARDRRLRPFEWNTDRLAAQLDLPGGSLQSLLTCLERRRLIENTGTGVWRPTRAAAGIDLIDIVLALRATEPGEARPAATSFESVQDLTAQIEAAVRERLAGRTLADLIDRPDPPDGRSPLIDRPDPPDGRSPLIDRSDLSDG